MSELIEPPAVNVRDTDYNKDFSLMYEVPNNGKTVAHSLVSFALTMLKGARCIKDIHLYHSFSKFTMEDYTMTDPIIKKKNLELLGSLALDQVVDDMRIVMSFENYMKALLLSEGYLIHNITQAQPYAKLKGTQKDKPIKLEEVTAIEGFKRKDKVDNGIFHYLPGIGRETVRFSWLLKDGYQEVIKLPAGIFDSVKRINMRRNNLHLYDKVNMAFGPSLISGYLELERFVDNDMTAFMKKMAPYLVTAPKEGV